MLLSARWTLLVFIAMATRDNNTTAGKHEYSEHVCEQFVIIRENMYLCSVHRGWLQNSGIHHNIIHWKDFDFGITVNDCL